MTEPDKDEVALDALFASARAVTAQPGDDLVAAILRDADAVQTQSRRAGAALTGREPGDRPVESAATGGWRSWLAAIGGWPAAGGMALATLAGVWIGLAPPAGLTTLTSGIWGETVSVGLYADEDPFGLLEG